jgi:hypothetical protein
MKCGSDCAGRSGAGVGVGDSNAVPDSIAIRDMSSNGLIYLPIGTAGVALDG